MAIREVTGVTIGGEGHYARIKIDGFVPGMSYNLGMSENTPEKSAPKIVFNVTSMGFDDDGQPTTVSRKVYGTCIYRTLYSTSRIPGTFLSGTFLNKETIVQANSGATAMVYGEKNTGSLLRVVLVTGYPDNVNTWTGSQSGATFSPSSVPVELSVSSYDETEDGTSATVIVGLSDFIYKKDNNLGGDSGVAVTVKISEGFATNAAGGGQTSLKYVGSVTNSSTLDYPKVISQWSMPGWEVVGPAQTLRCVAFHGHAQRGRMVRCVKFTTTDGTHTAEAKVTAATIDKSFGDAMPIIEYIGHLDLSGLDNGVVTSNMKIYPWIGDSDSIIDTTTGAGTGIGAAIDCQKYVLNKAGTYSVWKAVVDSTNGDDATGAVGNTLSSAASTPFKTIGKAIDMLRQKHNTEYSRNNAGGGTIYLRDNNGALNNFAWTSLAFTAGTAPDAYLYITNYPGCSRSNLVIDSYSTSKSAGLKVKISNIKITSNQASGTFDPNSSSASYWFDNCEFDCTVNPVIYRMGAWQMTRCLLTNLGQGCTAFPNALGAPTLIRGCTIISESVSIFNVYTHTFIGNRKPTINQIRIGDGFINGIPALTNQIIAFNKLTSTCATGTIITLRSATPELHGIAIVQNILEVTTNGSPAIQIAADLSNTICNNVVMHNNLTAGQRASFSYNEYGASGYARYNWSVKNNIFDDFNIKVDSFLGVKSTSMTRSFAANMHTVTVGVTNHQFRSGDVVAIRGTVPTGYNGNFVLEGDTSTNSMVYKVSGNSDFGAITVRPAISPHPFRDKAMAMNYGTMNTGNMLLETSGVGAANAFMPERIGFRSYTPTLNAVIPPTSAVSPTGYMPYVARKSWNGAANGSGNGDYHANGGSPAFYMQYDFTLPYDLDGNMRSATDSVGPYCMDLNKGLLLGM